MAQATTYWRGYRVEQSVVYHGGYPFADVIRELTPRNSVIIVAGADWAAMTPLYAQRKALMIRNGLEHDQAYLERAFDDLAGEEVSALVVYGPLRMNRDFIERVAARFDLEPRFPTFSFSTADTYVARLFSKGVQMRLKNSRRYTDLTIPAEAFPEIPTKGLVQISPAIARDVFTNIIPGPFQMDFEFGLDWLGEGLVPVLSAHPNSDIWVRPPSQATQIKWSFGMFAGAYQNPEASSDGVEFVIHGELPDGGSRVIYRRLLDPAKNPADRPDQHEVIPYTPLAGENLRFSTWPNQSSAYDWAYTIRIEIK